MILERHPLIQKYPWSLFLNITFRHHNIDSSKAVKSTMIFDRKYLYHPFKESAFGFFHRDAVDDCPMVGEIIENVNLYHQPVEEPLIATVFLLIKLCLVIAGEYLFFKVFQLMKKEKGILKEITQLLVYIQSFFWPFCIFFTHTAAFIYPMKDVLGEWYCYSGTFLFYFLGHVIISHSFITALMRYIFILQPNTVNFYGKDKVKRFFLFLSLFLPLLGALWELLDGAELDALSFINQCHGKHHQVFLIESSAINVAKRNFCAFDFNQTKGVWSKILALIQRIFCIANTIVQLTLGLNIAEGFLYFKILRHINR